MTVEPTEQREPDAHVRDRAAPLDSALLRGSAAGSGLSPNSPLRWVFVIVPLVALIAGAAYLIGVWATSSRQAAREDRSRQAERRVPGKPLPADRAPQPGDAPSPRDPGFDARVVVALLAQARPEEGASVFKMCSPCHTSEKNGPHRVGSNLWDIVGQPVAADRNFNYSATLRAKGGTWTYRNLAEYLHNPRKFAPGTSMAFAGISKNQRMADLIAYLRTLSDNPQPLPN